jgi:LPXTG-site transpeptidase (sortase) family protein
MVKPMHQLITERGMNRGWRFAIISPLVLAVVMITSGLFSPHAVDASAQTLSSKSKVASPKIPAANLHAPLRFMAKSNPTHIYIPAIALHSNLMRLGLLKDGSLQVPPTGFPAGWYTGSPTPGEIGPSIIAGHIDWNGPGVFYHLNRVRIGDQIMVTRADGKIAKFAVTRIASFLKNKFPTSAVYGNLSYPGLRLITCGDYDFKLHKYVRDLVVFATLI